MKVGNKKENFNQSQIVKSFRSGAGIFQHMHNAKITGTNDNQADTKEELSQENVSK